MASFKETDGYLMELEQPMTTDEEMAAMVTIADVSTVTDLILSMREIEERQLIHRCPGLARAILNMDMERCCVEVSVRHIAEALDAVTDSDADRAFATLNGIMEGVAILLDGAPLGDQWTS